VNNKNDKQSGEIEIVSGDIWRELLGEFGVLGDL
jgi:hypothetical protein